MSDEAQDIENSSAVQLFAAYARRAHADFAISDENRSGILRICRLAQGLPLAIELAAAWVRVLPCEEIAQQIESNIDFLATASKNVPERHRSLRAVFVYSWIHLSKEEQVVFSNLSIFKGGFRREAAEQVAGASLPVLASLLDHCLIQRNPAGRYNIHGLLHEYGAEKLAEHPEQSHAAHNRHCLYFSSFVSQRVPLLMDARAQDAQDEITAELENIEAARGWAARQAKPGTDHAATREEPESGTLQHRHKEAERLFDQTLRQAHALQEQAKRANDQAIRP